jgi:hypothetical protein
LGQACRHETSFSKTLQPRSLSLISFNLRGIPLIMASTAKKELSAGTLNLKFMTRASHDGPPIPALTKKKVTDEGEWDIGPDVRRALGISDLSHSAGYALQADQSLFTVQSHSGSSAQAGSSSVTYESSYMPFVTSAEVKGRFTYKDGIRQEAPEVSGILIRRSRTDLICFIVFVAIQSLGRCPCEGRVSH